LNIALFGPPGAGKGTQSEWLIPHLELVHIAPGDILRQHIRLQTDLGKSVQPYIESGALVPNELVISAITTKMEEHADAKGFLFDGYPRTRLQAKTLDEQLASQARTLDLVLFLQVGQQTSYERIQERKKKLFRVDDQSNEKIATRFKYYHEKTLPVTEYYREQEKLIHIPGESEIPRVREHIHGHLQAYLTKQF
ncbi:MAG: nucleoside monophosphate kinase, partial [Bacteroidota bacterium]